jgi:glycosyltransferase involved in cell wall biosynthesis
VVVVRELAQKSNFPITLISASQRVGKSRIDNEAVAAAQGDFILWCDSDDYLLPGALQTLLDNWNTIPPEARPDFCGVTALCDTKDGVLGNRFYSSQEPLSICFNELSRALSSDMVIFTRAELLKKYPFIEVDFLISESSVWSKIGVLKTRFTPTVLQRKQYGAENALSHSGHMSYNRGHAHALALAKERASPFTSRKERLRRNVNYIRYCRHGEIPWRESLRLYKAGKRDILMLMAVWPASQALALKDHLQGKVRKTHRDFLAAQAVATVSSERLGNDA